MNQAMPLPQSTPEAQGIASQTILDFVEAAEASVDALHSFILVRHGQKVAEGWWAPYVPELPHMLFSLSKSFTSTAVGLAVAEGLLSVDDTVLSFFPDETPDKVSENLAAMKVCHLLSMSTGHAEDTTRYLREEESGDWIRAFLARPVEYEPGTHFLYNSGASFILSAIVQKLTGMPIVEYLQPRIFDPLGIEPPMWESNPQGINMGGWGLNLKTEDIARFGQLYLQKGQWEGEQLIPASWVEEATTSHIDNAPNDNPDWEQGYGYQFWRCRHNAYRGDGAFGQYCVVMPDQDAVFAATSGLGDMQAVLNLVWDYLLPAMKAEALPADASAHTALMEKLATLRLSPQQGEPMSPIAQQVSGQTYTLEENSDNLESVRFDFDDSGATMTTRDALGEHRISIGYQEWVLGATQIDPQGHGPEGDLPTAASGAWTDDHTYITQFYFYTTPLRRTTTCRFEEGRVKLEVKVNVSLGPNEPKVFEGRA